LVVVVEHQFTIFFGTNTATMSDEEDDGLWEKPAWAKGGVALKKTGKAEQMKGDGNLAAPITFVSSWLLVETLSWHRTE
jgi:hypothetical protein